MNPALLITIGELAIAIAALVGLIAWVDHKRRQWDEIEPLEFEEGPSYPVLPPWSKDETIMRDQMAREREALLKLAQQSALKRGPQGFQRRKIN